MSAEPGSIEYIKCADKPVRVCQVIITSNQVRGKGTAEDPLRNVTQVWSMEGDIIAEYDPIAWRVSKPPEPG